MISPYLAKELKDAGFPQVWPQTDNMDLYAAATHTRPADEPYIPTTVELISELPRPLQIIILEGCTAMYLDKTGLASTADDIDSALASLYCAIFSRAAV